MADFGNGETETSTEETQTQEIESLDYDNLDSQFNPAESSDDSTETPKNNPAWNDWLAEIPEEYHSKLTPHLLKNDQYFQSQQQKYAPYKDLVENNVDPQLITNAINLGQLVSTNPRALFDELQERYNFSPAQAQQAVEDQMERQEDNDDTFDFGDPDEGYDLSEDPRFTALQQEMAEFKREKEEYEAQRDYNNTMARIKEEVDAEWAEVEKLAGGASALTQSIKQDIEQRALRLAGENGNPSILDGFKDHVNYTSQILKASARKSAPNVLSGNGFLPVGEKYDVDNSDHRQAKIRALLQKSEQ